MQFIVNEKIEKPVATIKGAIFPIAINKELTSYMNFPKIVLLTFVSRYAHIDSKSDHKFRCTPRIVSPRLPGLAQLNLLAVR